jgi:UDP-glucuronate 4-epimerase
MRILITGVAGFIGFSICQSLLLKNNKIIGIDSLNNYYNLKLKKKRLALLKNKNFDFKKIDLINRKKLFNSLNKNKIDLIIHLAAQPGVRYSLDHPRTYIENNISAFSNILDYAKNNKIKLIYASSSSVYGETKKFPVRESDQLKPNNIYALTKKTNEEMAKLYAKLYGLKIIGLRFFTVFGEWGRPDMFILKFLEYARLKKKFPLYNYGNHSRDFTYINDLVCMISPLFKKIDKMKKGHYIFNVCTGKSRNIKEILNFLIKLSNYKNILFLPYQSTEVKKTHGSNKKLLKISKFKKFTEYKTAIQKTFNWYSQNKDLFN